MKAKRYFLLLMLLPFLAITNVLAQQTIKVVFTYKFAHVSEGMDYVSRMKVYIDGNLISTSADNGTSNTYSNTRKETEENTFSVEFPVGKHILKAMVESNYKGTWEEHLRANGYSLDCIYEKSMNFTKDVKVKLIFDIDTEKVIIVSEE